MKKVFFFFFFITVLFSCEQEIDPLSISYSVGNVTAEAEYTTCTICCTNESVDGEKVKMRVMVSSEESMQNAVSTVMQVTSEQLICNLSDLLPNHQYYFCFELFTNNDVYRLDDVYQFTTKAYSPPTVVTKDVTDITYSSVVCGGSVIDDGGDAVYEKGICWGTNSNPTIKDNYRCIGNGLGDFLYTITDLQMNTGYCVRAYAINSIDTAYGNTVSFTTLINTGLNVVTSAVSNINAYSAYCGGTVSNTGTSEVTSRGVCWSTSQNPTINGSHTSDGIGNGTFSSLLDNLQPGTNYYVKAYATNSLGVTYGSTVSFVTLTTVPNVTTTTPSSITSNSAVCGGNVTSDGGAAVTSRGVCWSTSSDPSISGQHIPSGAGTGPFSVTISNLSVNTTYYVRAFATNQNGTAYGDIIPLSTVTTSPSVTTGSVSNITHNSAECTGNVTSDGGASITARGICWSTTQNPTISGSHSAATGTTGTFTSSLTGLSPSTTYYVRAYATNANGTSYGNQITFTTVSAITPTVTTSTVSNITASSANCGGNVTSEGSASVMARGVCWSTSHNPTISGNHTINGTGTGVFTSSITGLSESTTYYVRAYATNSVGTNYGEERTFTTTVNVPTGALSGLFSVSTTQQVFFSKGNLQYHTTTHQWRFASSQNSVIGMGNSNFPSSGGCWIDLFGWGTGDNPTNVSSSSSDYSSFVDWGNNAITNGGNQAGQWRTLSQSEWEYILYTRPNASQKRGLAIVNGIYGSVILPDNWTLPAGCSFELPQSWNTYTTAQWQQMEQAGAVFLPDGGSRSGNGSSMTSSDVIYYGFYWSSTPSGSGSAYIFRSFTNDISPYGNRSMGYSVRLVQNH